MIQLCEKELEYVDEQPVKSESVRYRRCPWGAFESYSKKLRVTDVEQCQLKMTYAMCNLYEELHTYQKKP
jgi:hypothetical protein